MTRISHCVDQPITLWTDPLVVLEGYQSSYCVDQPITLWMDLLVLLEGYRSSYFVDQSIILWKDLLVVLEGYRSSYCVEQSITLWIDPLVLLEGYRSSVLDLELVAFWMYIWMNKQIDWFILIYIWTQTASWWIRYNIFCTDSANTRMILFLDAIYKAVASSAHVHEYAVAFSKWDE